MDGVNTPVGFDYSADLEEIKTLLESIEQGLLEVHIDLTQIIYVIIVTAILYGLWNAIFKHFNP